MARRNLSSLWLKGLANGMGEWAKVVPRLARGATRRPQGWAVQLGSYCNGRIAVVGIAVTAFLFSMSLGMALSSALLSPLPQTASSIV